MHGAPYEGKAFKLASVYIVGHPGSITPEGTVYLLHFERPYRRQMQHYISIAMNDDLEQQLETHRPGTVSATTKLAFGRGIGFTLVRT